MEYDSTCLFLLRSRSIARKEYTIELSFFLQFGLQCPDTVVLETSNTTLCLFDSGCCVVSWSHCSVDTLYRGTDNRGSVESDWAWPIKRAHTRPEFRIIRIDRIVTRKWSVQFTIPMSRYVVMVMGICRRERLGVSVTRQSVKRVHAMRKYLKGFSIFQLKISKFFFELASGHHEQEEQKQE